MLCADFFFTYLITAEALAFEFHLGYAISCMVANGLGSRGGGGGGGLSAKDGGRTPVTYFAEEGSFFRPACPRFCKKRVLLLLSMGGRKSPYKVSAALTPSDSRSDWASESAAAKQAEDFKI